MTDKDKDKIGKTRRVDLSKRIKKTRKSRDTVVEKPKKAHLDLDLIERRIRVELARQLGKGSLKSENAEDAPLQFGPELLSQ